MQKFLLTLVFISLSVAAIAQGTVKGKIMDSRTREIIIGATVRLAETTLGSQTDANGEFTINRVPAGTYKVVVTFISYQTKEIQKVRVETGNTTVVEAEIAEDAKVLADVVVKGTKNTASEVAVITEIKQIKSIAVGIGSAQITKSQDRDAAAAIKRVAGVSIVDNRFVMVRGLASRYNSVLVNDVITPSTEVDSRSFSFDLIPSSILDRMIVYKSGATELPGDFAGGAVKIFTKKPTNNFIEANASIGYRAGTTFQTAFTHDRGPLSGLGLWDAKNTVPTSFPTSSAVFNDLQPNQRAAFARLLPNDWGIKAMNIMPDIRVGINVGRRFQIGNVRIGNVTSINYSNTHQLASIALRNFRNGGQTANDVSETYTDAAYTRNTRLGVLHNWSARFTPGFVMEWNTLFNQLGSTETTIREGQNLDLNTDLSSYSLRFENRSILSSQLVGKLQINEKDKIEILGGFGYTGRWEPDWKRVKYLRTTDLTDADGKLTAFRVSTPVNPTPNESGRFFSTLHEYVYSGSANYEHRFDNPAEREPAIIRAGVYAEQKQRDFNARFYGYQSLNTSGINALPVGEIFGANNVSGQTGGFSLKDGTRPFDSYDANNTYLAGYVGGDIYFGKKASLTIGFRGEYNRQVLNSLNGFGQPEQVDNPVFSPLPSLNFTYKLTPKQNLRVAFSQTVNRPEFRELAPFSYFDFSFNADVRGNTSLQTAQIQNADLKWEMYPSENEVISVTGFYKHFNRPIENFLLPTGNGLAYTFINAKNAQSYGIELEMRKGFVQSASKFLQNTTIVANASVIRSTIDLDQSLKAPDLSGALQTYDLAGITEEKRPMMNQSPYLVNLGVYYAIPKGWQANVLYNVFGPRIFAVGNLNNPTVYEMPRQVVDFNLSRNLGKKTELRISIQDILNQPIRLTQDFNRNGKISKDVTSQSTTADQDIRKFRRGSYSNIGIVYKL